MLGHKLVQVLGDSFDTYFTVRSSFEAIEPYGIFPEHGAFPYIDISDERSAITAIDQTAPDVVINAIGIIKQLPSSKDVVSTLTANSIFPHRLIALSESYGFRLITISTDCVFTGSKGSYVETDPADASDLYGQSKHLGEVSEGNSLTLRTSIIGRELGTAHSLVEWFLANRGKTVNGYVNAIYSGFPTVVFADIISSLITDHPNLRGLYHVSSDPINKFELLNLVKERFDLNIEIESFKEMHIDRSLDSSRFRQATGFKPQSWVEMVDRMHSDPTPYEKWKR